MRVGAKCAAKTRGFASRRRAIWSPLTPGGSPHDLRTVELVGIGREGQARIAMPHWLNKDRPAVGVYDAIRKCTAFIGMDSERGFDPHGTGFFVAVQHDGYEFGYLVTAAHLIRDARYSPYVRINKKDGSSEVQPAKSDDWIFHHDRRMDICALPSTIYSLDDDDPHDILFMDIVTFALSGDRINRAGIAIGDEIFIANLFASRGGDRRNIPIIRM
jgi:hypothetical protein